MTGDIIMSVVTVDWIIGDFVSSSSFSSLQLNSAGISNYDADDIWPPAIELALVCRSLESSTGFI